MTPARMCIARPAAWLLALVVLLGTGPWARSLSGQQPPSASDALDTVEIRPNIFVIFGAGGNVVVQVGPDGAVVVDTGTAAMADKLLAAIKALTPKPIRYIFNTSADIDHVGGNEKLAAAGVAYNNNTQFTGAAVADVVAREEVLLRMSAPTGEQSPFTVSSWPTDTFTMNTKSMYVNGEGVQAIHQPNAHSDGDSIVFFRRADVIVTGDILDLRRFPVIDRERGGSIQGEIAALNRLLVLAIPAMPLVWREERTVIVPGHGRVADHTELVDYRDMITIVRDIVQSAIDKGRTLEQIKAANPTAGFRARYGSDTGPWTTDMFVEAVYRDLISASRKS